LRNPHFFGIIEGFKTKIVKKFSFKKSHLLVTLALMLIVASTMALGWRWYGAVNHGKAASLTNTSVVHDFLLKNVYSDVTFNFTTMTTIPDNGKIKITFPGSFVSAFDNAYIDGCNGIGGSFQSTSVANTFILTRNANGGPSSAGAKSCIFRKVKNPSSAGPTGTYTIQTTDSADSELDVDNAVASNIMGEVGTLPNTTINLESPLTKNKIGNAMLNFTTQYPLSRTAYFVVTFPAEFDMSQVSVSETCTGIDGTVGYSYSGGGVLRIYRNGPEGSISSGPGSKSCTIRNIKNPSTAGTTGTFSVRQFNFNDDLIQQNTSVPGVTIVEPETSTGGTTSGTTGTTGGTSTTGGSSTSGSTSTSGTSTGGTTSGTSTSGNATSGPTTTSGSTSGTTTGGTSTTSSTGSPSTTTGSAPSVQQQVSQQTAKAQDPSTQKVVNVTNNTTIIQQVQETKSPELHNAPSKEPELHGAPPVKKASPASPKVDSKMYNGKSTKELKIIDRDLKSELQELTKQWKLSLSGEEDKDTISQLNADYVFERKRIQLEQKLVKAEVPKAKAREAAAKKKARS